MTKDEMIELLEVEGAYGPIHEATNTKADLVRVLLEIAIRLDDIKELIKERVLSPY